MIGSHNYRGAIGDITIDTDNNGTRGANLNVYATTVGANSFSNGAFTTTTGTYTSLVPLQQVVVSQHLLKLRYRKWCFNSMNLPWWF